MGPSGKIAILMLVQSSLRASQLAKQIPQDRVHLPFWSRHHPCNNHKTKKQQQTHKKKKKKKKQPPPPKKKKKKTDVPNNNRNTDTAKPQRCSGLPAVRRAAAGVAAAAAAPPWPCAACPASGTRNEAVRAVRSVGRGVSHGRSKRALVAVKKKETKKRKGARGLRGVLFWLPLTKNKKQLERLWTGFLLAFPLTNNKNG